MKNKVDRREFLLAGLGGAFAALAGCGKQASSQRRTPVARAADVEGPDLAIAKDGSAADMVAAALKPYGGIGTFVKRGQTVVIKPNIGWARMPEEAANTNPGIVAALVRQCQQAGAKAVTVLDHTCDKPSSLVYDKSGIKAAAEDAGAEVFAPDRREDYAQIEVPKGKLLDTERVVKRVLDADVLINVPIVKVHSAVGVTLAMKNLMGVIWNRQAWHASLDLEQCIADFSTAVRPTLIILDATHALTTNGPKGPGKVVEFGEVIAGIDPVAVDAYGARLLGKQPGEIGCIVKAHELGVGEMDLDNLTIKAA